MCEGKARVLEDPGFSMYAFMKKGVLTANFDK